MAEHDNRVKAIEKIIRNGHVRHDEIAPALSRAGLSQISPDDISDLVKAYKYRGRWWARGKVARGIRDIGDKIGSYASAALGAAVMAEVVATRKFAGSLIGDKLQGFGDNLRYWLGLKKIEISGPEMMYAMGKVVGATLDIVKGMAIGVIIGYVLWKVITRLMGYLLRRRKRKKEIEELLNRYSMKQEMC